MEFQFTIYVFVFTVTIFLFIRSRKSLDTNKNLPPHPWKLPLIGHLHHLLGGEPHHALANLATKLGPLIHLQLGELSTILISSPLLAREIMKTHDLSFASRPKFLGPEIMSYKCTDIAFSPYGDYWRQMRKICVLELLSAKKVQSFQSIREEESWNVVEFMDNQKLKTINFSDKIFSMMNTITCRVVVGSRFKDQARFVALIKEMVSFSLGFDVSDLFPSFKVLHLITNTGNKMMKIRKKIDEILDNIISDHQECRAGGESQHKEDILDVLLRLKEDGGLQFPLTSDNIKAVLLDVFVAGTDTSSSTIVWAMSELMKKPMAMKKAQAELRQAFKGKKMIRESDIQELDYLKLVIKETLRLHPPAPLLLPRECREKCEIGGYDIHVNTKVIINMWKIGRDPNCWIDPDDFIPERFSETLIDKMGNEFEYFPFGSGRRMCPGITMGLASVELPLAMLLYHFNWDLPNGATYEDLDMSESFGATLSRKHNLLLVPSPYDTNQ